MMLAVGGAQRWPRSPEQFPRRQRSEAEAKSRRRMVYIPFLASEDTIRLQLSTAQAGSPLQTTAAEGAGALTPRTETLQDRTSREQEEVRREIGGSPAIGPGPPRTRSSTAHTPQDSEGEGTLHLEESVASESLRLPYKWSNRFASGRLFPSSFINQLAAQVRY